MNWRPGCLVGLKLSSVKLARDTSSAGHSSSFNTNSSLDSLLPRSFHREHNTQEPLPNNQHALTLTLAFFHMREFIVPFLDSSHGLQED